MAGDPFRRVQPGQPLEISADAWNAVVDAARDFRRRPAQGGDADVPALAPGECYVENKSGQNLDQFAVLGISDAMLNPNTNAEGFAERSAVTGVKPTADHEDGKFAVVVEPVPDGQVARAVIGGSTVCKINVTSESHKFAKAKADTTSGLVSSSSGPCVILWKQAGTGDGKWALVRFGGSGGGAVRVQCTDALSNGATCKAKLFDPAVGAVGDEFEVMVQHLTKVNDLFYVISAGLNSSNLPTYLQLSLPTAKLRGMTLQHMDASGTLGNVDWDYPKGHGV